MVSGYIGAVTSTLRTTEGVVTQTFDRAWWRPYAARLAERFQQDAIHVRAVSIEMLDDDAS